MAKLKLEYKRVKMDVVRDAVPWMVTVVLPKKKANDPCLKWAAMSCHSFWGSFFPFFMLLILAGNNCCCCHNQSRDTSPNCLLQAN